MRGPVMHTLWILLLGSTLAVGCAHSTEMPEALAARPLLPPPGAGAVSLGGGLSIRSGSDLGPAPAGSFGLDLGLSEHVAILDLLTVGVGGELSEDWSLAAVFGIVELGRSGPATYLEGSADPRRSRLSLDTGFLAPGAGLRLHFRADPRVRLILALNAAPRIYSFVRTAFVAEQSVSVVVDVTESLGASMALVTREASTIVRGLGFSYGLSLGAPRWHSGGFDLALFGDLHRGDGELSFSAILKAGVRF